jgi:molecular chaperone DnaK (HSP70)
MIRQRRHVLSIDFGTANTIAVLFDGQNVDKVTDSEGQFIMPSSVYYNGETPLIVGWDADALGMDEPDRYKTGLKRELGIEGATPLGGREFSRAELVAEILSFLRQNAEGRIGETIHEAVLTVPAAYDEYRRDLMVDAGKAAGLDATIVAEPVAAAFTEASTALPRPILVYDFGAGTFDAAVVGTQDGELAVIGHAGLPHCGGLDIDQLIYNRLRSLAEEDSQRRVLDGSDDSEYGHARRLRFQLECRHQKEMLSKVAVVRGSSLVLDPPLRYELTRDWLETAEKGLILKTINCCRDLLDSCDMRSADLDHVLLVGGSSHAPIVARMVESELDCTTLRAAVPETAVAEGAAQWAWNAAAARERTLPSTDRGFVIAYVNAPDGVASPDQAPANDEEQAAAAAEAKLPKRHVRLLPATVQALKAPSTEPRSSRHPACSTSDRVSHPWPSARTARSWRPAADGASASGTCVTAPSCGRRRSGVGITMYQALHSVSTAAAWPPPAGTGRRECGTPPPTSSSSPCSTPIWSIAWRSARTAIAWQPPAET